MIDGRFYAVNVRDLGYSDKVVGVPDSREVYDSESPESAKILGMRLTFNVGKPTFISGGVDERIGRKVRPLEVVIEGDGSEEFKAHINDIVDGSLWKRLAIGIRQKRNDSVEYLRGQGIEHQSNGTYVFTANLATQSERKAWEAIYNNLVRPLLIYGLESRNASLE